MSIKKPSPNFIPNKRAAATKNISEILTKTLKAYHLQGKIKDYSVFPRWEEILGSQIAKVAIPEKIINRKVLQIRVLDAVWAQELIFKKEEILEKLNNAEEGTILEDLKFVIGNPKNFKEK